MILLATPMERTVAPEWLDHLPPADPRAVRSRRDLRRINAIMRNAPIVARALTDATKRPPACIVELGAGDGAWMAQLACALPASWSGVHAVLLDRQDTVATGTLDALSARGWVPEIVMADAFDWLAQQRARTEVIVANLFLHHFVPARLCALLELVAARSRLFAACEPRRCSSALHASRLLRLAGCNEVTRHDAVVSVRAGFAGRELSASWPDAQGWHLEETERCWFSHLFVAARR